MLADGNGDVGATGTLQQGLHRPKSWLSALLDFIATQLPAWRDRPDRPVVSAETHLTAQLCGHLNGVARKSPGWDALQFRVEEPDERQPSRRIDLAAAPAGAVVWIEGRRYSDFDPLLPIECKRLPTPRARGREKREYLRVARGSTGGVQRFKAGLHGAAHDQAAIIAFIQSADILSWAARVDRWVRVLVRARVADWEADDRLIMARHDLALRVAALESRHQRGPGLAPISLRHLWIEL